VLEAEREKQIKTYLSQPIGYVWQQNKKLPDHLSKIPIPRPVPTPGALEQMFPRITVPEQFRTVEDAPAPQAIYGGYIQTEDGRRLNLWTDSRDNPIDYLRGLKGEFGETVPIAEY
jgi:hypothetical protein